MKIISWNMGHRKCSWEYLTNSDADFALLQEALEPSDEIINRNQINPGAWETTGAGLNVSWRTAIVKLSDRFNSDWIEYEPLHSGKRGDFFASIPGTLSAAHIYTSNTKLTIISAYSTWASPFHQTNSNWIYADASAHRLISDLSVFIGNQSNHNLIVAGDFNLLFGYGENGSPYWKKRYDSVFERMNALGFVFLGPQSPNGRQAYPWPTELPSDSKNAPTFYHSQQNPETASRQLDYVFASKKIAHKVNTKALNTPQEWGPSDHCQVVIEFEDTN